MSAWVVSKGHIMFLVAAAVSRRLSLHDGGSIHWWPRRHEYGEFPTRELRCTDFREMSMTANMLWRANCESVGARYPGDKENGDLPGHGTCEIVPADFRNTAENLAGIDPVQVLKACDCYEYQTCENDTPTIRDAFGFIDALRSKAWRALAGYDGAEWGAPKEWDAIFEEQTA